MFRFRARWMRDGEFYRPRACRDRKPMAEREHPKPERANLQQERKPANDQNGTTISKIGLQEPCASKLVIELDTSSDTSIPFVA
jgi:hypothetical protein